MNKPNKFKRQDEQKLAAELMKLAETDFAAAEDIGGTESDAHRQKMSAMLADPKGYAKSHRRLFREPWFKNCVACLVLLLAVTLGTDILLESANAGFFSRLTRGNMQITGYETHDLISFNAEQTDACLPEISLAAPEGYQLYSDREQNGRWRRLEYRPAGEVSPEESFAGAVACTFAVAEQGYQAYIETGGAERESRRLSSGEASFYQTAGGNYLVWLDEERGLFCMLDGRLSADELAALAESVRFGE